MELKATDPLQYDSPDLDWRNEGGEKSSSRTYFRRELDSVVSGDFLKGKRVLDVGSGVGQLFQWCRDNGATDVVGIDPSARNVEFSIQEFPWATSIKSTLHEFVKTKPEKFDTIFIILVLEHILDLQEVFRDTHSSLKETGEVYIIFADKDYNLSSDKNTRGKKFISVEVLQEFENGVVETKILRRNEQGVPIVMHDILRPTKQVEEAALVNGFQKVTYKPILGPRSTLPEERKLTMCHLYVFRKK
jgi:2-polyprenyl-3-methyl-5-hydroxy-6-metoxy-1,4-benzoquinol methylase